MSNESNQALLDLGVDTAPHVFQNIQKRLIKGLDGRTKTLNVLIEEDLNKGIIIDELSSNKDFVVLKMGSEIKLQLQNKKNQEEICKTNLLNKLVELREKIPAEPTETIPNCWLRGAVVNTINFPKQYSGDLLWGTTTSSLENVALRNQLLTPEAQALNLDDNQKEAARQYNNILYDYVNCLVEIVHMDSLINNLTNDQMYPLTNYQLITLGF